MTEQNVNTVQNANTAPKGLDLTGKSVVVTGANSGIGAAIAKAAAAAGANVLIDWVGHEELVQPAVDAADAAGPGKVIAVRGDVTKMADLQNLVDTAVREFGRLDAWVNNAGLETRESLLDQTEEGFDLVMNVNLKGAFFGAQVAAKQMVKQGEGGVVVNISSVHETWPMPGNIAYCLAKGGILMMTRTAGAELGGQGIRFLNIAPGAVDTPINTETMADPEKVAMLNATIPLGRVAEPEEIAETAVFAMSDAARYMTATTITVDGGMTQYTPGL